MNKITNYIQIRKLTQTNLQNNTEHKMLNHVLN